MGKKIKSISAILIAIALCLSFATVGFAYADNYPNTHRNTGHHIADLIAVAKTQLGYTELNTSTGLPLAKGQDGGYTKYGASFGNPTGAWCAYFVSWCATQAGIPTSIVPRLGNCARTVTWYREHSRFYTPSTGYIPKTGDIVFFNWSGGSTAKHIGIITGVSGKNIYTIEGNTDSSVGYRCAGKTRDRTAKYIVGYGVPAYNDAETYVGSYSFASSVSGGGTTVIRSQSIAYSTSKLSVITTSATDISSVNAVLNGSIENSGKLQISSSGFLFGTSNTDMKKYSVGSATKNANVTLSMDVAEKTGSSLAPNSTYYYQTYVTIGGKDYIGPTYAVVTVNDKPQQLVLSENNVNVGIGQTTEIMAAQLPIGSTDKGISWSSADEKIATVSDGLVKGVGFGKVIITAKTNYGDLSKQCIVNVLISAPQDIKLVNNSDNSITLKWNKVNGAKQYVILRASTENKKFEEYTKVSPDKTSFEDTDVKPGMRYYYKIQTLAGSEEYNSDLSAAVYTTAKLSAPKKLKAQNFVASSVRLTWNEAPNSKSYTVYRACKADGLYTAVGTAKTTEFVDTTAAANKEYFYKITAENGNDKTVSDYSDVVSVNTRHSSYGVVDTITFLPNGLPEPVTVFAKNDSLFN